MGTGTTLRQIINMTTDCRIIDHPKRWKYMVDISAEVFSTSRLSLLHGGHSLKQQRPLKDKPHDDDDDDDDELVSDLCGVWNCHACVSGQYERRLVFLSATDDDHRDVEDLGRKNRERW